MIHWSSFVCFAIAARMIMFVWRKADGMDMPDDHGWYKLKPKENVVSPVDRIKNLPVSKLSKLQEFMDELEKGV